MKKFFKNIWNLILRHKLLTTSLTIALIVGSILGFQILKMFISSGEEYGNRLDGISKVEISEETLTEVENTLKEKKEVADAKIRIQGKIIYFNLVFTRETKLEKAKEIANETLKLFKDEEKSYYDFGYFLTQTEVENKEDTGYIVTGNKNAKLSGITWIKS